MADKLLISSGILLNFARTPFYLPHPYKNGLCRYEGVEWRFHAMKSLVMVNKSSRERRRAHGNIVVAESPSEAKSLGRALDIELKKWDAMCYQIMLSACLGKFSQHRLARETLLSTENAILIEHRPDPIWGDKMDGSGKNWMGQILEQVRRALT